VPRQSGVRGHRPVADDLRPRDDRRWLDLPGHPVLQQLLDRDRDGHAVPDAALYGFPGGRPLARCRRGIPSVDDCCLSSAGGCRSAVSGSHRGRVLPDVLGPAVCGLLLAAWSASVRRRPDRYVCRVVAVGSAVGSAGLWLDSAPLPADVQPVDREPARLLGDTVALPADPAGGTVLGHVLRDGDLAGAEELGHADQRFGRDHARHAVLVSAGRPAVYELVSAAAAADGVPPQSRKPRGRGRVWRTLEPPPPTAASRVTSALSTLVTSYAPRISTRR